MPIGISDAAAYHSVSPFWVITWAPFGSYFALLSLSCTVMYLQGTYCFVSCYPFPLKDAGLRFWL